VSNQAAMHEPIRTTIPARIDRLWWSPFHTRMIIGLGVAWILDGLQITIASSVTGVLAQPDTLDSVVVRGRADRDRLPRRAGVGALVFGRMSDKLGRRRLFMLTLGLYLIGTGLTAFTLGEGPG
jgi:MFS family permease